MPYLIKVGPKSENKSGVGSEGYHIYRRANTVIWKHGQVEVIPMQKVKVFWKYIKPEKICYRSREKAIDAKEKKLNELIRKKYQQLRSGVKILPKRKT